MKSWIWVVLIAGATSMHAAWADDFYNEHAVGWHWYNEMKEQLRPLAKPKITNPSKQIESLRLVAKQALDAAIIDPSPANMAHYIALQNQLSDQSSKFSAAWKSALLTHPEFNYSLIHPTNQVGLSVYHEQQNQKHQGELTDFAAHTGLFFFFKGNCPYCKRFAPILKHFADIHHLSVLAITLDGEVLPEYLDAHLNHGQAKQFNVKVTPSVFAVNPYTGHAYPVTYGLVSEDELSERILHIMEKEVGDHA